MGKADRKHIADVAEGDESRKSTCSSTVPKDITEEHTRDDHVGISQLSLWDRGEVGH